MINVNQQALLELLKASLFGAEPHFPEGVDWDAVLKEAKDQTVVALVAPAVPKEEAYKWQIPAAQNKMSTMYPLVWTSRFSSLLIKNRIKKVYQRIIYYTVSYDYGYIHTEEQVNDLYLKINKNQKQEKHAYSNDKRDKYVFIGDKNIHSIMRVAVFGDVDHNNVKHDCAFFTTRQLKNKKLKRIHDVYYRLNKKFSLPFKSFFEKRYTTSVIKKYSEYNVFFIFLAGAYFEETFSQPYLWKQIQALSKKTYVHKILYLVDPVDKFPTIKYWFPFFDLISGYAIEDVEKYGIIYISAPCVSFRELMHSDNNLLSDIHIRAQGREKTITEIYEYLSSFGVKCDFHIQVKNQNDYNCKEGLEYTHTIDDFDNIDKKRFLEFYEKDNEPYPNEIKEKYDICNWVDRFKT